MKTFHEKIIDKYLGDDDRMSGDFGYDEVVDLMKITSRKMLPYWIISFITAFAIGVLI